MSNKSCKFIESLSQNDVDCETQIKLTKWCTHTQKKRILENHEELKDFSESEEKTV